MKQYSFCEGQIPDTYTNKVDQYIFNKPAFRALHAPEGWHSFYVLNDRRKKVVAAIHFHISGRVAKSPLCNPFGSVEHSRKLSARVLFEFLQFVEQRLKQKNVATIHIKTPPQAYHADQALIQTFLLNLNYRIMAAEVGAVIGVSEEKMETLLHRSTRRKLQKAQQAGLVFRQISIDKLDQVYAFIENCRASKDYTLSLDLGSLQRAAKEFPDHYLLFGVFQEQALVAASIAVRVKHDILYEFYHDHTRALDLLSPVVLLVEGIYSFCQANGIRLLDLGTSAIEGYPNFDLLTFKLRLGAKPTPKLTFEKTLS